MTANTTRIMSVQLDNLTPEQQRLYDRLVEYCAEHHMWCGSANELAVFADLPYPIPANVVYGLVERKLIKHHCLDWYALTVCEQEAE